MPRRTVSPARKAASPNVPATPAVPATDSSASIIRVALTGSSGGSTQRGNASSECTLLIRHLKELPARLTDVVYVEADCPLDHADGSTAASLWLLDPDSGEPRPEVKDTLDQVNSKAHAADARLAETILAGGIDVLVLVSAAVVGNGQASRALAAAVKSGTPVLGSGGTGLGEAVGAGANVLQLSGSVATTASSRAVAVAAAIARHFHRRYTTPLPPPNLAVLPVLDAILPVVLTCSLLRTLLLAALPLMHGLPVAMGGGDTAELEAAATRLPATLLPVAIGAIASSRAAKCGESGTLAGVVAGLITASRALCLSTTPAPWILGLFGHEIPPHAGAAVAAALVGGPVAGLICRVTLSRSHAAGLPATACTLLTVGGGGLAGGLAGHSAAPLAALLSGGVHIAARSVCESTAACVIGALLGAVTKQLSLSGYYHSLLFPIILTEMELGACNGIWELPDVLKARCNIPLVHATAALPRCRIASYGTGCPTALHRAATLHRRPQRRRPTPLPPTAPPTAPLTASPTTAT